MGKMLRIPLAMMVSVLSVFLVAGGANAVPCPTILHSSDCGCVAGLANTEYSLGADMICTGGNFSTYGIIIGAAGVTIDGKGYKLEGRGADTLSCAVTPYNDECLDCPCRNPLPSGIINANTAAEDSCNSAAGPGQGGCDGVTVKNLEITGWCDGIFISGDCNHGDAHPGAVSGQTVGTGENSEYRLTSILIEKNVIHDNGRECSCTGCSGGCTCDNPFFNDGIFLAQVGVNSATCDSADLPCKAPYGDPCSTIMEQAPPHSLRNIVTQNLIYHQSGCCCESCPGGNCVNLCSGIEVRESAPCIDGCWYAGCNEVSNNICKETGCSCVQLHFGSDRNRIHNNECALNGYVGIGSGCDWLNENYIYRNSIVAATGPGIAMNSPAHIYMNFSINSEDAPSCTTPYDYQGYGILIAPNATADACLRRNTCVGNASDDIKNQTGGAIDGDLNVCYNCPGGYTDNTATPPNIPCTFKAGASWSQCKADADKSCDVNLADFDILSGEWNANCCSLPR